MHLVQVLRSETQVQKSVEVKVKRMGSVPVVRNAFAAAHITKILGTETQQYSTLWLVVFSPYVYRCSLFFQRPLTNTITQEL